MSRRELYLVSRRVPRLELWLELWPEPCPVLRRLELQMGMRVWLVGVG
ncbi:hypothetical protein FB561_4514 [Kribbella amoyensis]|uniref:Uncharacterized protein n=1 Tax=Kribbella amoyensis TaxID=996641 RepID=A0A561BXA2_9ACTN|nr:hypothetical protein FB561_4514 [Kribbella amoyensis]